MEEIHLDLTIDENKIIDGATEVIKRIRPSWPLEQLLFKVFTNGLTNKLVGVWYPDHYNEMVLVRIYGDKTDLLINRQDETRNIRILNKAGYTYGIYATFNNGLAYEFIEGDTLTVETIRNPEIYVLIAQRMAQMHLLQPNSLDIPKKASIWEKTERFMELMPKQFSDSKKQERFENLIEPYTVLKKEYEYLKANLACLESPIVFAHNDLLLGNVLYNKKAGTVTFIDYEYTAYNYQAFDIANHFAEFAGLEIPDYSLYPEEELQRAWLKVYLCEYKRSNYVPENEISQLYVQVNKFVLLSHFFWGCWSLIQSEYSSIDFDYLKYATVRFDEYFKRKDEFLKMTIGNC